ncbi:hypothetical protein U91I_00384 [alpha proteobacterium U9-1i]|nr:hypothetical protein U91I_00384 [alpha proteobacterium U9-1i]
MALRPIDLVVVAALAVATGAYVVMFHFPAPYFDHWDLVPMMRAADAGALSAADLFVIHGGHWHASAYALLLPLAQLTDWSHLAEALLTLTFLFAACALLALMARDFAAEAAPEGALGPFVIAAVFLCLSLDQSSNLLWGFQLCVYLNLFGVALCLWALTRRSLGWREAALAQLALAIAVTSYATGFALIPTGLALIVMRGDTPWGRRALQAIVWLAASAAWCIAFVLAQRTSLGGGGFDVALLKRPEFWAYLPVFEINYVGASIARTATALIWPLALLSPIAIALGCWALARRGVSWRALSIPLASCIFSIGAGLLCALGRFEFGAGQGGNGRYFTFSHLFWIGAALVALAWIGRVESKAWRRGAIGLVAILALLKLASGVQAAQKNTRVTAEIAAAAAEMRAAPEQAGEIAQAMSFERQDGAANAAYLRDKGWSVFR